MLETIGIAGSDEAVYLALLEHPRRSVAQLARELGRSAASVRGAVDRLEECGFVSRLVGAGELVATRPDAAVGALVVRRTEELTTVQRYAQELAERYPRELRASPGDLVSIVVGKHAVEAQFVQLLHEVEDELLVFDRPPYAQDAGSANAGEVDLLAVGTRVRGIYAPEAFETEGAFEQALRAVESGEQARVHGEVPMKLALGDLRLALLPLTTSDMVDSALIVRAPMVVTALAQLFELMWRQACPLTEWEPGAPVEYGEEMDDQLLALLATGLKDEAIARELGVSVRTLGRRTAALLDVLGARNRFQAGVQAERRRSERKDRGQA